jgi:hypothetical protein
MARRQLLVVIMFAMSFRMMLFERPEHKVEKNTHRHDAAGESLGWLGEKDPCKREHSATLKETEIWWRPYLAAARDKEEQEPSGNHCKEAINHAFDLLKAEYRTYHPFSILYADQFQTISLKCKANEDEVGSLCDLKPKDFHERWSQCKCDELAETGNWSYKSKLWKDGRSDQSGKVEVSNERYKSVKLASVCFKDCEAPEAKDPDAVGSWSLSSWARDQ